MEERLMADLNEAMRSGDDVRRDAIRMLRSAMKNEEIELRRPLSQHEAEAVVTRVAKRHRESIEQFKTAGRADLVAHEEGQLATLEPYLPRLMSREQVEQEVRAVMAEPGAQGPRAQGKIMSMLAERLRGRADLKDVSSIVRDLLNAAPSDR